MNNEKITILCSTVDRASQNIKEHLLSLRDWKTIDIKAIDWSELTAVYENEKYRIIEIDQHHIYQDKIDKKMDSCGFNTNLIIVASKHKSADGRAVLTTHFTGNPNNADFGGRDRELSVPAPSIMRPILMNMKELDQRSGYEINMESTHHGPSDVKTPMVYAEIGSGEEQWSDPEAGELVARSILEAKEEDTPIAIGIGGGHYASRQTKLILETYITFGHNFPDYQLENIDKDMVLQAFVKSNADFVYFDRKSMQSKMREKFTRIIDELGYLLLRENEIREMKGIPWKLFLEIRSMSEKLCPNGRFRISDAFRADMERNSNHPHDETAMPEIVTEAISEKLLQQCITCDKNSTIKMLDILAPIYLEKDNGIISNFIMGFADNIKIAMQDITNECIKILKEHYAIKYIPEDNILHISDEQFSPELARNMGIPPGPMYGKLARKESIVIDGRTIGPEMVHVRKIKTIPLSNAVDIT
ncbi:D-aminoacyl-tRNA deacylase [Methanolobus sp. ZRKC3]|uniref:D-aminoacyl-tRNA deacylase n=1 Tax=Methanolobus sp. ZRKC3 TaxID=3125786 RepID=UPI0032433B6C